MASSEARKITELLDRSATFEDLGRRVQGDDVADAELALRELEAAYGRWYAEALTAMPSDLIEAFKAERDGNFFQVKIKRFLEEPRALTIFKLDGMPPEMAQSMGPWMHNFDQTFRGPLLTQRSLLEQALARLTSDSGIGDVLDTLEAMARRIPDVITVLQTPLRSRPTIEVKDEYDLQRVLHGILVAYFDDVRPEEFNPSKAGSNTRIDFLLKEVRVAVEAKMTRPSLTAAKLGDELAADILRYKNHRDAGALFVLVHDPGHRAPNSRGFEQDMRVDDGDFPIRVVITH